MRTWTSIIGALASLALGAGVAHADPKIINKTFVLNGAQRTLIGVMPPRFALGDADMWIPQRPSHSAPQERNGFPIYWFLLAHLKPGVSIRQAESDLTVVAKNLSSVHPKDYPKKFSVHVETLTDPRDEREQAEAVARDYAEWAKLPTWAQQ